MDRREVRARGIPDTHTQTHTPLLRQPRDTHTHTKRDTHAPLLSGLDATGVQSAALGTAIFVLFLYMFAHLLAFRTRLCV